VLIDVLIGGHSSSCSRFETLWTRNCELCSMLMNSKSQRHSVTLIFLRRMVTCLIFGSKSVPLADVIATKCPGLRTIFHVLGEVSIREYSDPVAKFTHCDRFQNLAFGAVSTRLHIDWGRKPIKRPANLHPL
jgi:hypothetical protein